MIQNYLNEGLFQNYLAPSYPIFIQIKYLLSNIHVKKSLRTAKNDILHLVAKIGSEGQRFLLTNLLELIDPKEWKEKNISSPRIAFLAELIKDYSANDQFLVYFPEAIASLSLDSGKLVDYISTLFAVTKLPIQTQITSFLALYLSDLKELSEIGQMELERKLKELRALGKGVIDVPEKILEELLFQISQNPQFQARLQNEFDYLLENCQNYEKVPFARMYNYLKNDWHYFAAEPIVVEKLPVVIIRKVDFLREVGPAATASIDTLKIIMSQLGVPTEEDVFDCLLMMAEEQARVDTGVERFISELLVAGKKNLKSEDLKKIYGMDINAKKTQSSWNLDNFIAYCSQNIPNFKWQNVYNYLDRPRLQIRTEEAFLAFMKTFEKARRVGPKFKIPEHIFFRKWNHPQSQAVFLTHVFKCREIEVLGLAQIANKKIQKSVKDCNSLQKQVWGYLDLVQQLVEISDYSYLQIRELFEIPLSKYPQLLIQTLAEIRPTQGQAILDEIFSQIFPLYLQNHSNYIRLLESLWEANQDLVISSICELYKSESKKENSLNLSRVLDIAQVIKESLIPLTNWNDYQFSVPLAILAGKREFLHFDPWISERIKTAGNSFLKAILSYIEDHLLTPIRKCLETSQHFNFEIFLEKAQLSKELLAFIYESIFLTTSSNKMTKRNLESLKRTYKEVCHYFPEMSDSQIPDQIEQLAQLEFVKIYKKEMTIQAAVEQMKRFKNSQKSEEKELFASMITFMYSELRFHANYPENELLITADLFAGVINNNLIQKKLVQVLLQVLEDDLKEDNKKYIFAKIVIEKIQLKLLNEAEFIEKLLDNSLLLQKDPELIQVLIKSMERPMNLSVEKQKRLKEAIKLKQSPPQPMPQVQSSEYDQSVEEKKCQNYDYDIFVTLDRTKEITLPEKEAKLSKINTICNTLSLSNIDEKAKDLQKIVDSKKALHLLAYNIVFKRVSIAGQQSNGGIEIFYRLIEKIPHLETPVRRITYSILEAWFALTTKSVNDKKIGNFKTLGFWLGKLTLGRGTPILINQINLKDILIRSYTHHSCRLPLNISVVLKMLENITSHREIFRVNNPWLGRILGTLNEIQEKLKEDNQNSRSQIKAFFINTDIKKNSSLISATSYLDKSQFPLISRLPEYIKISDELHKYYMGQGIDLKMFITKAVDESIQEIVEPVIDRAVKIAIVTARQLILKDFALESDPQRFKTSFNNVVKKLAGPLAQVTCREPLKGHMNRTLKSYLSQRISDAAAVENIISKAITDNLDLGCALIKKAVIESADESIRKDTLINESVSQRSHAYSQGAQFRDENYLKEIPAIIPEQLRPKAGGLSLEEYLIYEQFKKERKNSTPEKIELAPTSERIADIMAEKGSVKSLKEILISEPNAKDQFVEKIHAGLLREPKEELQMEYYLEICEMLKELVEPNAVWISFKEKADLSKKSVANTVRKLVREKYFLDSCLSELDEGNEQEQKAINMFQKWLDTAHEQIEPFFQSLEQNFNKSESQIRLFFEYSLNYALQKVEKSISEYHQTIDTTYIEDYSKLIIISYKLISSNNSSLFLEHTLQAILQVFNKLLNKDTKVPYQRPFFKLFLNLICDATRKEYGFQLDKITEFYYILAKEFHKINPLHYPNFAFAWVQLISNKYFMPSLLERYEYWDLYYELICDLLKFAKEHLSEDHLSLQTPYQVFYKGLLRIIIILAHDFPDFLPAFSLQLVLQIPDKFVQIRNLIISAIPKELKLISPKAILNRESLEKEPNIQQYPKYYSLKFDKPKFNNLITLFQNGDRSLRQKLEVQSDEVLQVFVLYFAWIEESQMAVTVSRKIFIDLIVSLDGQIKEKLMGYALNLIRYPNAVTVFFIDFVSAVVFKGNNEKTRNLLLNRMLEKINIESTHPWGILYLVNQFQLQKSELIKLQIPQNILSRL